METMKLETLVEPLLGWYNASHRILPWREHITPYRVWISEIMLQQTRVEAVKPYYERFLQALPDIGKLAAVSEEELLKLWEGLGYYNRARNLKKAAILIEEKYGGQMPKTYAELLTLPGIGSYTAGAIASIAFGEPVPAVDGNVLRILARVLADDSDIKEPKTRRRMEGLLAAVMPDGQAGAFNQAMMELGAVICIPNGEPKCVLCPWREYCRARAEDAVSSYPKKSPKKARGIEEKTVLLLQDENRTALHRRPFQGLLAGMYEFPTLAGHRSEEEVLAYLKELGYKAVRIRRLEDAVHIFTHKEWHMIGYAVRVDELERPQADEESGLLFVETEEAEKRYPIPSAFAAYAKYLRLRLGNEKYR